MLCMWEAEEPSASALGNIMNDWEQLKCKQIFIKEILFEHEIFCHKTKKILLIVAD